MSRREAIISATLPVLPILIPLGVHFVLVSFVLLIGWLPFTYIFSHLILFLVGLWACHDKDSLISAIAVIVVILFTMLLDIIQLGLYFPGQQAANGDGQNQNARTWQFSAGMCIINLLFKPLSIALGCVAVYVRGGGPLPGITGGGNGGGGGGGGDSYTAIHGTSGEDN